MPTKINHLSVIQAELKAPKNQFNSFGKYKYRSCEDIVEAVKPLLATAGGTLILSDEMIEVGDRVYVAAKATINIGVDEWSATGMAREAITKKGMDDAQITGAASSYARKYALNGLLAIDDTKDADSGENAIAQAEGFNQKIANALMDSPSVEELIGLWEGLSAHQKQLYEQQKNAAKARLSGA